MTDPANDPPTPPLESTDSPTSPTSLTSFTGPVIDVADWFRDCREVCLQLDGVRYRLRITRRNKLILQK